MIPAVNHAGVIARIHWKALVGALFVAFIYIAPSVIFSVTPQYAGIQMTASPDEEYYLTFIQYISEQGHPGNPYLYEYREDAVPTQWYVSETLLAFAKRLSGLSIANFSVAMRALFPALIFLAFYALAWRLSKDKAIAFLAAGAAVFGTGIQHFMLTVGANDPSMVEFLLYARPVNPNVSGILWVGALITAVTLFNNPRSRWVQFVLGGIVGALAYAYFFFWFFALMFIGVIGLYVLIVRDYERFRAFFVSGIVSLVVAIPFLISLFGYAIPSYAGADNHNLLYASARAPIIEKVVLIPLLLFACFFALRSVFRRRASESPFLETVCGKYVLVVLLLLTCLAVSNQQIVTGRLVEQHHFHFFTSTPLALFAAALMLGELLRYLGKFSRWGERLGWSLCAAILVAHACGIQTESYVHWFDDYRDRQKLVPAFAYLKENTPMDTVVYANRSVSELVPLYTSRFDYSVIYAMMFPVPYERKLHNYFIEMRFQGVTADQAETLFRSDAMRSDIGRRIFGAQTYRELCGTAGCFPDAWLDSIITEYKVFMTRPFEDEFKKYKVNYVLADEQESEAWHLSSHSFLSKVFEEDGVRLYTVQ